MASLVFEGNPNAFDTIVEDLKKYWMIKFRAVLGPEDKDDKETSILNRVVRWDRNGIEYEADPRHVEKLLREMGMQSCRELSPGTKPTSEQNWGGEVFIDW